MCSDMQKRWRSYLGDKGGDKTNVKLCSSELEPARRVVAVVVRGREGAPLLLVFLSLREVKLNLFGALRVCTHEPGRLFACSPYATLNTSPAHWSDGTLSLATYPPSQPASRHPCKRTHMRPHVSQGLGLITWVRGKGNGEGRRRLSGATVGT